MGDGCSRYGDSDLPSTEPAGRAGAPTITLIPAAGIAAGVTFPVQVAASLSPDIAPPVKVCLAVSASPGKLMFPFDMSCSVDEDAGTALDTGDLGAAPGGREDGAAVLVRAFGCARVDAPVGQRPRAEAVVAYLPSGNETHAALFGAVYADTNCGGEPLAEVGVTVTIPGVGSSAGDVGSAGAEEDGSGAAGTDDGGRDAGQNEDATLGGDP
jgi:hypothetical protein